MKASSATSARESNPARRTARSSAQPTRISAEGFALAGPSQRPDPNFNAYRQDLADCRLAGKVIASHYAEPVTRVVAQRTMLRDAASDDAQRIVELAPGDAFYLLDDTLGWAWGYGGEQRRVGYVPSAVLAPA